MPPLIEHASARERIVLLVGLVMMLPALRSQMNCSSGSPNTSGMSGLRRGSMQVSATTGSESTKSFGCNPAVWSPARAR